jgi:peptidoglycan/xylan/chitin deacetylase (PgdA/CDA1 family)
MSTVLEKIAKWLPFSYQEIPAGLRNFVARFFFLPEGKEPMIKKRKLLIPINKAVVLLTHDVDTSWGYEAGIHILRDIERKFGFNACYNFVAKSREYEMKKTDINCFIEEGCEIASHGLYHDGKFGAISSEERKKRIKSSKRILKNELNVEIYGFRSPWLAYTKDLFMLLEDAGFKYDMSLSGSKTIFPYQPENYGVIEFPLTIPQDYYLLNYKRKTDQEFLELWLTRLHSIECNRGLIVVSAHPDKYDLGGKPLLYEKFLEHIYNHSDLFQAMLPIQLFKMIEMQVFKPP